MKFCNFCALAPCVSNEGALREASPSRVELHSYEMFLSKTHSHFLTDSGTYLEKRRYEWPPQPRHWPPWRQTIQQLFFRWSFLEGLPDEPWPVQKWIGLEI